MHLKEHQEQQVRQELRQGVQESLHLPWSEHSKDVLSYRNKFKGLKIEAQMSLGFVFH